ncbi:hypothetical protein OESDEN_13986 [Oesophagostomum dentatum]|uniref:Uncharacterized protein n=1 Tax=Oesophagostomum dentatum TaxID=61180 RepID=A0A0B1SLS4_OESDE|nr:hypothetical protein OESDEN_13986 [Oesophagostomum dentatum]
MHILEQNPRLAILEDLNLDSAYLLLENVENYGCTRPDILNPEDGLMTIEENVEIWDTQRNGRRLQILMRLLRKPY